MKKYKSSEYFEKFLKISLHSTIELSEDQIDLLSPGLSESEVFSAVERAGWAVQKTELLQSGLLIFSLIDKRRTRSCGEPAQHYHLDEPCCGREECCPEFPVPPDYELEIAWNVSRIREEMEKRKEKTARATTL